jgi:hypothetical protein
LHFFSLCLKNQQLQWKLKTMSCCNYRFFIKTKPTIQNSTQKKRHPKLEKKILWVIVFFENASIKSSCVHMKHIFEHTYICYDGIREL